MSTPREVFEALLLAWFDSRSESAPGDALDRARGELVSRLLTEHAEWLARFDAAQKRALDEAGWAAVHAQETARD